jgi:hypothetical protein
MRPQYIGGIQIRTKLVITETNKTKFGNPNFAGSVPEQNLGKWVKFFGISKRKVNFYRSLDG